MKYILIFIADGSDNGTVFGNNIPPGSMYEVGRFNTVEEACGFRKTLNERRGDFIIMTYYEC